MRGIIPAIDSTDNTVDREGDPGAVILSAPGSITVQDILSSSNVNLTSNSGNIKTGAISADGKVVLSAVAGNIEVDAIKSGEPGKFVSGDISITSGGFFRAIRNPYSSAVYSNYDDTLTYLAYTEAENTGIVTIKTKNESVSLIGSFNGQENDNKIHVYGRINIEVGSEIFLVGTREKNGSLKEEVSGSAGAITTAKGGDEALALAVSSRTFGNVTPTTTNPPITTNPPTTTNTPVTTDTPATTVINNTGSSKNEAQSEIPTFGVLSLDKSLVARLKYSGHATKLTLSNDGKGELTGSTLNAGDKEEENGLNEVFNLDGNLPYITVLNHS